MYTSTAILRARVNNPSSTYVRNAGSPPSLDPIVASIWPTARSQERRSREPRYHTGQQEKSSISVCSGSPPAIPTEKDGIPQYTWRLHLETAGQTGRGDPPQCTVLCTYDGLSILDIWGCSCGRDCTHWRSYSRSPAAPSKRRQRVRTLDGRVLTWHTRALEKLGTWVRWVKR